MVPEADDELTRLAYLLGALPPEPGTELATFLRDWLADPPPAPEGDEPLRRGLATLTPRQRAAVVLCHWSGRPASEVAELLDCPEQTVELETAAALDVLATDEQRLAADLAELAAAAPVEEEPEPGDRRWRSAGVAAGVLVAAGVFAGVLGVGEPAGGSGAEPSWTPPPATVTPTVAAPSVENPAPSFDNRARRLTAQLAAARPRVLPRTELQPAAVSSPSGTVLWAPLVFHVADTPDLYLAMATIGAGHDAAVLKIDVGYRSPDADPPWTPCPEYQQDCTYRKFADGTYGAVAVFTEPASDQTINRLTVMRPDGTFGHVSVFYKERRPDPPPLDRADLFRFATVFRY
jgi:hypothetical protein